MQNNFITTKMLVCVWINCSKVQSKSGLKWSNQTDIHKQTMCNLLGNGNHQRQMIAILICFSEFFTTSSTQYCCYNRCQHGRSWRHAMRQSVASCLRSESVWCVPRTTSVASHLHHHSTFLPFSSLVWRLLQVCSDGRMKVNGQLTMEERTIA